MKDKRTISHRFQVTLAIIVALTLALSTIVVFIINTFINKNNYSDIIASTITDVERDIEDTSDANMLAETIRIKSSVTDLLATRNLTDVYGFNDELRAIVAKENLSEMSIVNTANVVIYSSHDEYIDFDMNSSPDTLAFDVLNHGATEVVQPVRANAYDGEGEYAEFNKYAGVPLEGVGYLQVAINPQQFQTQIDTQVNYIAANRHIGQSGLVIISNLNNNIVSYAGADDERYKDVSLSSIGINFDNTKDLDKTITCKINGVNHMTRIKFIEGYYIIGLIPTKEVQSFRDRATIITVVTEVIIFLLMFLFIKKMINSQIVSKIHNINDGLQNIISGSLNTKISEYSTTEFASLSDDINSTVTSLKEYMDREQEKIKQELEFAKSIQLGSLPKLNTIEKYNMFDLHATMDTAKEVGGDFYDFYMVDDSKLAFLIADVSGKGVPAALFMMTCKTMLKNLVDSGLSLSEAFNKANESLCESNDADMFVTVWMGLLDLKSGNLDYINAGHNPPLVYNSNKNKFEYLKSKSGFILSGVEGLSYKSQKTTLSKGDKIFLYTDGVTEANNLKNELYGEKRLQNYLNSVKDEAMKDILLGLKSDIDSFVGEATQFDDITMLGIKFIGQDNQN